MFLGFLRAPPPFERPSTIYLLLACPVKFYLRTLYQIINALRVSPPFQEPPVRIVSISDTHTMKPESIPVGDILIHAGDLTNDGTIPDIQDQIDWLASLPHPHKFCIAGNHDTYLDPRTRGSLELFDRNGSLDWKGIHYLQHSTAEVTVKSYSNSRTLTFYGAPQIPACGPKDMFAFQYEPGFDAWSDTIPDDVDVLITHTPPKNHLEIPLPKGLGCQFLRKEVRKVKPALHVFGHVHWGAGQEICHWDEVQLAYDRGMDRPTGWTRGWLDICLWLDVARVLIYGVKVVIWERVWGGEDTTRRATRMVNAAQMWGNTGKLASRVQVVLI